MSDKLEYLVQGQVLEVVLNADHTVNDFIDLFRNAFDSETTPARVAVLIDGSQTNIERTDEEYQRATESLVAYADRIICLAYVTLSDTLFGIIEKAASYAEYNEWGTVRPFRDAQSAKNWIETQL